MGGELDGDELSLVMEEIRSAMSARGTALTIHPDDSAPSVIFADERGGLSHDLIDGLLVQHFGWTAVDRANDHRWEACAIDESCKDFLLIPVQTVPGHSRLLISVYFDHLTKSKREQAENIYKQRRPFAVGYFRLWQINRARKRESDALKAALNLTEMGIILVDRTAKLTFANRAAKEILLDGGGLRVRNNTIRASQLRDSVRLQVALEHVIASNGARVVGVPPDLSAPLLSLERCDAPPLIVSVLPTTERASEPDDVAAIIYVLDPSRNVQEMLEPVCQVYSLSPVETRLTRLLVGGSTLIEA